MTEHGYIRSIHRRLPASIYRWKINDNFEGGVADAYYSGEEGDLWIEYKYLPALPKRSTTPIRTCLSAQQRLWLTRRHSEGRQVAVVIGSPDGAVIQTTPDAWNDAMTRDDFIRSAVENKSVANYIVRHTTPAQ